MATTAAGRPATAAPRPADESRPLSEVADLVPCLLTRLQTDDFVVLARDDERAARIAAALAVGAPRASVLLVPASDVLPGDDGAATPANAGRRTRALRLLRAALSRPRSRRERVAVVSSGEAAARLYPPPRAYGGRLPTIVPDDPFDPQAMAAELEAIGYLADERVDEPGEFAMRGQVLDVFPADADEPCRIELAGDRVASIRAYDPASQLTMANRERLELVPGGEADPGDDGVTLLEHAPGLPLILDLGADERRRRFIAVSQAGARRRGRDFQGPVGRDLCPDERWRSEAARHDPAALSGEEVGEPPQRFVESRDPLRAFTAAARAALAGGGKVLLLGSQRDLRFIAGRAAAALHREFVEASGWGEVLAAPAGTLLTLPLNLDRGFRYRDVLAVAAADLLGGRADRGDRATSPADPAAFRVGEIRTGDVVVDEDHGIAVVAGLDRLPDGSGDAIVLRFAGDARRLVPVAEAGRLWRYGGEEGSVRLDSLDGSSWEKRRGELYAALAETARALVALAAERMRQSAPVLEPDPAAYEQFAAGFPFTETADQARAIAAVRADLASGRPMDRLVVGDVGYGKTEVALRAAALAALAGKQVVVAAPTTVLVRQHLETFVRRFDGTGIEVAGLSRLSPPAEKKAVKAGLADGSVRIVIGTGAVAGKGVRYADLALVIVDEEQRFGAADKARLRGLASAHVLSLSATPIPRTLQSALVGLQQLSLIATPPARRQPLRTLVAGFDEQAVRTALLRERSRRGQSFVVVPRIEDMKPMAARLATLAPELVVLAAHGKLPAADIDEVMVRFADGDGDVLLATNIIEAGLDVPRANTMLVWRADRFGLAQLHQLRGRVGRAARRGHVLLLTEPGAAIAPRTLARLNTLSAFDRLGAGFAISARDLDMRGAGDLLGDEQAGHLKLIGVDLYQHLLERALRRARGEEVDDWLPVVRLAREGGFDEAWIPDADVRLGLYARLARIADLATLDSFAEELIDRFGEMPAAAGALLGDARVRVLARLAGVERIDAGPAAIALTPRRGNSRALVGLGLEEKNGRYLLHGAFEDVGRRSEQAEELLARLADQPSSG